MSLKDSLDSARARAGQAKQEAEREAALVQNFKKVLAACVDLAIRDAAAAIYQSICGRIADEIYRGKSDPRSRIDGYVELPDRLRVPVAGLRSARAASFDFSGGDVEPEADGDACSVRLTRTRREELFWGYRVHPELTQSGTALVEAVRRRAASEGVSTRMCVIEKSLGSERRCIEMSQFNGTARCTDGDGINCYLALRYGFNNLHEGDGP